jgi:hypothetical protein
MNSRIRELANKAGMVEVEYHPGFPDIRYPKNFEKFAQLIVRECIDALDKEVYLATREDGEQAFHDVILLEHFGVAE